MHKAWLSLGSNEGDRTEMLLQALEMLADIFEITEESRVYETEPWGITDQPKFLNMCIGIETELGAYEVLEKINEIEAMLGRLRKTRWGQRTIDIDIVFFEDKVIAGEKLTIPHKYMHERAFVLVPLNDIAPDFVHPLLKKTVKEMLDELPKEKMTCLGFIRKNTD
ncbi:MAG: 2-amino-4-hydroxy-6-hydroxymethyldihydropteridine diphosphokinase [Synergistaceae bacterium]|nr:2-amino-4-hydroxy-6-hydroxymethyldihydropteridine diphosphokinase [Synergistaceae bacterium]